ncbi:MAG: zinc ribbon domain-containing protein [Anaerolineaceae bacterium]
MPIYEYKCEHCQDQFEAIRKMIEADEPIACPSCHHLSSSRMITAAMAFSDGHAIGQSEQSCESCHSGNCGTCGR